MGCQRFIKGHLCGLDNKGHRDAMAFIALK